MLTSKQRQQLHAQLSHLAETLSESIAMGSGSATTVELDQTLQGRVSRGDALQQQAMAKANIQRNTVQLRAVRAALQRIDQDDYGYCQCCGNNMDPERLAIMPEAVECIACKQTREQQ